MQFTTGLLSVILAAASVTALPGSSPAVRQNGERIYAKFFSDTGCVDTWVEDTVWLQDAAGACIDVNIPFTYQGVQIAQNLATRALRAYSDAGCSETTDNHFDVPVGIEQCFAQTVKSVKFLL